ncbi:MAG: carboxypeptidase-like regulatory domain-containing protein, partial [Bacteroidota bacterium]|nr:carboxypeptidase-like regulatory domain-containing protein [Bacteroidota bacterium]
MKSTLLCLLFYFLSPQLVWSQQNTITGKITTSTGEPAVGATVKVKGTATATSSDVNGNYRISVPSAKSILVITMVG